MSPSMTPDKQVFEGISMFVSMFTESRGSYYSRVICPLIKSPLKLNSIKLCNVLHSSFYYIVDINGISKRALGIKEIARSSLIVCIFVHSCVTKSMLWTKQDIYALHSLWIITFRYMPSNSIDR